MLLDTIPTLTTEESSTLDNIAANWKQWHSDVEYTHTQNTKTLPLLFCFSN
jgi:hypothetical protein